MTAPSRRTLAAGAAAHGAIVVGPVVAASRAATLAAPPAVVAITLLVAAGIAEAASLRQPDRSRLGAPGTYSAAVSALGLLVVAWLALVFPGSSPLVSSFGIAGVVMMTSGIVLRVAAIRALGDSFTSETVFVPGQRIVESGVYRYLDHPSDDGLGLLAVGLSAVTSSTAAALATAVVVITSTVVRVAGEDRERPKPAAFGEPARSSPGRERPGPLEDATRRRWCRSARARGSSASPSS